MARFKRGAKSWLRRLGDDIGLHRNTMRNRWNEFCIEKDIFLRAADASETTQEEFSAWVRGWTAERSRKSAHNRAVSAITNLVNIAGGTGLKEALTEAKDKITA